VLYAIGYAGHGVALASYAGRMIADLLLEREGPGAALWTRRHVPLPPEPLRWGVAMALIGLFEWMDRRADRG
jgi:glycine/D-amino acid oxidase-like deaminating enzyme